MSKAVLHSINYAMGETESSYHEIPGFHKMLSDNCLPNTPALFGWGSYFSSEKDIIDLGLLAARKTLAVSSVSSDDIDTILFCSTDYSSLGARSSERYTQLVRELQLVNAYPIGITLNACTTVVSALQIAETLLRRPESNHILIVSADKIADEKNRCSNYAIFSDGAVSCVLSKNYVSGFEVRDVVLNTDYLLMSGSPDIKDLELYQRAMGELLSKERITNSDIKKVFSSNIYSLISNFKEARVGVRKEQLYQEQVSVLGHCFSADPLINLCEYSRRSSLGSEDYYLLTADGLGLRALALLRYIDVS